MEHHETQTRSPETHNAIERLASALRRLGVRPGGTLLVHSSLKSLGHVPGGPETLIAGLLAALGEGGTLLLPALTYATVYRSCVFDVRSTPACVGAIPEYFRTRRGTLRSVHPTHSVCGVGPRAAEMLADHHLDATPCGQRSAFRRLRDAGGQVLMLGCGLRPNTSMHAVEELPDPPPFLGEAVDYQVTMHDGRPITLRVRRHAFVPRYRQRYDRLDQVLGGNDLRRGKVLSADCHLIECRAMWEAALAKMRRDPYFFVDEQQAAET